MPALLSASSSRYDLVVDTDEATVCAEAPDAGPRSSSYQSEADLERELVSTLCAQAYERLRVDDEAGLVRNLRLQLERLNGIEFTDPEWERFFRTCVASDTDGILEKTRKVQDDWVQLLRRDDGTTRNVRLIDKGDIHNNRLQVMDQYEANEGSHRNRYDVTILVNGLPLVHVELKRRGVDIREAFNQIGRYQRESFWSESGLFEYVQIFVISNGTETKYYSNTTRERHVREGISKTKSAGKRTSDSFEFTSWWADAKNRPITDLMGFARTFLSKRTLLGVLTRYCVLGADNVLYVMRPYQICATERILNRILVSENDRRMLGTVRAGGYVWHATGSGKTLTSFKCAQLASRMACVDKVLFVVDRKDLDYQTMREYDKFERGAVNSNTSTAVLARQLADPECRIIVTTIQKLANFVRRTAASAVYDSHIVIIFDECHRSQFGEMRKAISHKFRNYHLFGFTGTPIFAVNAPSGRDPALRTTAQAFGDCLHTYTIVDAIRDGNVLPFRIDYLDTVQEGSAVVDKRVYDIDREAALLSHPRIEAVCSYVLDHFDQKTARSKGYALGRGEGARRVMGFNSIFAAQSIPAAKAYYSTFKRLMAGRADPLRMALIYSWAPNAEDPDGFIGDEDFSTYDLSRSDRDFLDMAIGDYNEAFHTSFSTDGDGFEGYYKDVSDRMKNRELDMLVVVNMFLTGFDATTLNTLWVDKGLRMHGLIQAFSRTNRILNSVKTFGNIVCFRNLREQVDDAIGLFGDPEAQGIVLLRPYGDYLGEYQAHVAELTGRWQPGEMPQGEADERDYIKTWGAILRLKNVLSAWDQFASDDPLDARAVQDYSSVYLTLWRRCRDVASADKEEIIEDLTFEIELVKQVEVNIDYILMLVERYHAANCADKEVLADIDRAVGSSPQLRDKKDLIDAFVASLTVDSRPDEDWGRFVAERREAELDRIITEERLRPGETREFVAGVFRDGALQEGGTAITRILPPMSRFSRDDAYGALKERVLGRLRAFFNRFEGIG